MPTGFLIDSSLLQFLMGSSNQSLLETFNRQMNGTFSINNIPKVLKWKNIWKESLLMIFNQACESIMFWTKVQNTGNLTTVVGC